MLSGSRCWVLEQGLRLVDERQEELTPPQEEEVLEHVELAHEVELLHNQLPQMLINIGGE